jgi:hypothetical protein
MNKRALEEQNQIIGELTDKTQEETDEEIAKTYGHDVRQIVEL